MLLEFPYARRTLPVRIPDDCDVTVIRKRPMAALDNPQTALRTALTTPTNAPSLATIARGKSSVCIVICDITRPVPNGWCCRC